MLTKLIAIKEKQDYTAEQLEKAGLKHLCFYRQYEIWGTGNLEDGLRFFFIHTNNQYYLENIARYDEED